MSKQQELTSRLFELINNKTTKKLSLTPNPILDQKLEEELNELFEMVSDAGSHKQKQAFQALISGLYLWNGSMDNSHKISQDLESKAGSYLHGILHRIEPDYSNAKYWFRMAGGHPAVEQLQQETLKLLRESGNETLFLKLSGDSNWNPALLTDSIAATLSNNGDKNELAVLEQIQGLELEHLLRVELSKI